AVDRNHLSAWKSERGGNSEWHTNPEASECARVQVRRRLQTSTRKTQKIPAIRDGDVIGVTNLVERVEDGTWMNLPIISGGQPLIASCGRGSLSMAVAQSVSPCLVDARLAIACSLDHRIKHQISRGEELRPT